MQNKTEQLLKAEKTNQGESAGAAIESYSFTSDYNLSVDEMQEVQGDLFLHELVDMAVTANAHFKYEVLVPEKGKKYNKAIVLLHGLNEKSWEKYYAWGTKLCQQLNRPVIFFPLAYHMNRAPEQWSNPRHLKEAVQQRKAEQPGGDATFANVALSIRLDSRPEQFIYSGVQSYYDIWKLARQIKAGDHPLFEGGTVPDFFAYSIGAFLAEILMISNPGALFTHSRLMIFAGGTTFDRMHGTSRYIMDLNAFKSLLLLRKNKKLKEVYQRLSACELPDFDQVWRGFYAMVHGRKGRKLRNEWLKNSNNQVFILALQKDKVMPLKYILKAYKGSRFAPRIDVIDFPFAYTHENPFPATRDAGERQLVNRALDTVFEKAVRFFARGQTVTLGSKGMATFSKGSLSFGMQP
jgi:hypothetical protein